MACIDFFLIAGVHPHDAKSWGDEDQDTLSILKDLLCNPEVVAVGECGLDFNRNFSPPNVQLDVFEKQVCSFLSCLIFFYLYYWWMTQLDSIGLNLMLFINQLIPCDAIWIDAIWCNLIPFVLMIRFEPICTAKRMLERRRIQTSSSFVKNSLRSLFLTWKPISYSFCIYMAWTFIQNILEFARSWSDG